MVSMLNAATITLGILTAIIGLLIVTVNLNPYGFLFIMAGATTTVAAIIARATR